MIFRINKTENYTVMGNYHLREKEMSLKAKGLLSLMLSLPSEWDYSINGLANLSKDGKDSVMRTLNELENFGYLIRTKSINEKGQFDGYNYDIYEKPNMDKPCAENPNTANPTQLNTIIINNKNNKKEINKESSEDNGKVTDDDIYSFFDKVYAIYPRKVNKVQAKTTFEKKLVGLTKDVAHNKAVAIYRLLQVQITAWQKENDGQGRKVEHIPHFSTWLSANVEDSIKNKR